MRGGTTNKAFLLALLERAEVRAASADTGWLDRLAAAGEHVARRHADVALLQAAIDVYDAEFGPRAGAVLRLRRRAAGRACALRSAARLSCATGGTATSCEVFGLGPNLYRIDVGGRRVDVQRRTARPVRALAELCRAPLPCGVGRAAADASGRGRRRAASDHARRRRHRARAGAGGRAVDSRAARATWSRPASGWWCSRR